MSVDSCMVRVLQSPKRTPSAFGKQSGHAKTPSAHTSLAATPARKHAISMVSDARPHLTYLCFCGWTGLVLFFFLLHFCFSLSCSVSRLFASAAAAVAGEPRSRGHNRAASLTTAPPPPPEVHFTSSGVVVRRGRVDAQVDALIAAWDEATAEAARRERQGEVVINGNVYHTAAAAVTPGPTKAPRLASRSTSSSLVSHLVSPSRARSGAAARGSATHVRRHTAEGMVPLRMRKHEWPLPDDDASQPPHSQGGSYFGVRSPPAAATTPGATADASTTYSDTFTLMSGNTPVSLPAGREFRLLSAHNHSRSHYRESSLDGREVAVDVVHDVRTSSFAGGDGVLEIEERMEDRVQGVQRQSVLVSLRCPAQARHARVRMRVSCGRVASPTQSWSYSCLVLLPCSAASQIIIWLGLLMFLFAFFFFFSFFVSFSSFQTHICVRPLVSIR